MNLNKPPMIENEYRYDTFESGEIVLEKKKHRLPAMGWNSWNAFGSNNTEELTKIMADKLVELELDKCGYKYVILDDGCYKPERVNERLSNNEVKFPSGFKALADYVHSKGLLFGMYNDIGEKLCAGAKVGTCGYESIDAQDYVNWNIDFIKVDNCYYLWDNATFSNPDNARYVFAPNIKAIKLSGEKDEKIVTAKDFIMTGSMAELKDDYVTGIGTFDGTAPTFSPIGERSSEVNINLKTGNEIYDTITLYYATGKEEGVGSWLQLAINDEIIYDDFLSETLSPRTYAWSQPIKIKLANGENCIRIMNHRRQENTLHSYATFLKGLNDAKADHDIVLSICEWGKTQPQNWGYKVGDSWRILNDITFQVGDDGYPGQAKWIDDYTCSIISQYNKAVIMDEFAGLDKGWNDPDMLVIGMNGVDDTINKTHMAAWCMMNSPLMLGLDLRRVKKGDAIWNIIANRKMIALNQDSLGVQAKRIYCSIEADEPDKKYIRDIDRLDILAKPLSDGSVALMIINVSEEDKTGEWSINVKTIIDMIGRKMKNAEAFANAVSYKVEDLWNGSVTTNESGEFVWNSLKAHESVVVKISL